MSGLAADTHAAIRDLFDDPRLSAVARAAMEGSLRGGDPILLASIRLVEVSYPTERGRLPASASDDLERALVDPLGAFTLAALDLDVARALRRVPRSLIPDMPDRIIAATALERGLPLVTADGKIRASGVVSTL